MSLTGCDLFEGSKEGHYTKSIDEVTGKYYLYETLLIGDKEAKEGLILDIPHSIKTII